MIVQGRPTWSRRHSSLPFTAVLADCAWTRFRDLSSSLNVSAKCHSESYFGFEEPDSERQL